MVSDSSKTTTVVSQNPTPDVDINCSSTSIHTSVEKSVGSGLGLGDANCIVNKLTPAAKPEVMVNEKEASLNKSGKEVNVGLFDFTPALREKSHLLKTQINGLLMEQVVLQGDVQVIKQLLSQTRAEKKFLLDRLLKHKCSQISKTSSPVKSIRTETNKSTLTVTTSSPTPSVSSTIPRFNLITDIRKHLAPLHLSDSTSKQADLDVNKSDSTVDHRRIGYCNNTFNNPSSSSSSSSNRVKKITTATESEAEGGNGNLKRKRMNSMGKPMRRSGGNSTSGSGRKRRRSRKIEILQVEREKELVNSLLKHQKEEARAARAARRIKRLSSFGGETDNLENSDSQTDISSMPTPINSTSPTKQDSHNGNTSIEDIDESNKTITNNE